MPQNVVPIITRNMNSIETQFATRRNVALQPGTLQAALLDRLTRTLGKNPESATRARIYDALSLAVREELTLRWLATQRRVANAHVKRVCYFSVEYLPGRSLINALSSLDGDLMHEARTALRNMGHDLDDIAAQEVDPGLGNGGLGRLAACFLDSLATLQYPAVGYGIRYDYGIFTQVIDADGAQREVASSWLRLRNVWETPRGNVRYTVRFGGRVRGSRRSGRGRSASLGRHQRHLRRRLRSADAGQSRADRQSPAPVVGRADDAVPHRRFQRRRLSGRRAGSGRGEESVARAVSGRLHAAGQGAASQAAVFLREREPAGHPGDALERGAHARVAARRDRHAVERHASDGGDSGADAAADRRARHAVGRELGDHHAACFRTPITRCCPRRSRPGRWPCSSACCRGTWRSSTSSTASSCKRWQMRFPGDDRPPAAPVHHR